MLPISLDKNYEIYNINNRKLNTAYVKMKQKETSDILK